MTRTTAETIDAIDLPATLAHMADTLRPQLKRAPLMIGIHSGGAWIAEQLHDQLGLEEPLGSLDISFYRDDFTRIGMNPQVKASHLPVDVEDRHIILVDDVLHTGRTIRAALNEIFDYGRPASVTLAVLIERGDRELPIQADVVGHTMQLKRNQHLKLIRTQEGGGPQSLQLVLQEANG